MSESKYDYLVEQWNKFEVDIDIDEQKAIDKCFNDYMNSIKNKKFSLEKYAKPTNDYCSYFCNFSERTSSKLYGSARPRNMYNYGISYISNEDKYYIQPALISGNEKGVKYKKENKKEIIIYNKNIAENIFKDKILTYLEKLVEIEDIEQQINFIENPEEISPINATHMLRKIVVIKSKGNFLFAYADEAINTIYEFFIGGDDKITNIKKNYEATKLIKNIFRKKEEEDESLYIIRLSKFIWSIFGSTIKLEAKNMILHGAPGTGKTYIVKNTIKNIILKQHGDITKQLVFTQFHPSYSYEDFIDGIKPVGIEKGQMKFELKNGQFKELCRIATIKLKEEREAGKADEELTKFFFVADEINRAELSRVFGELLVCLEDDYRIDFDKKGNILKEENLIVTQNTMLDTNPVYKKDDKNYFGVPVNLYFIGTMNDIDRSVDSFDMALRRRFYWKEIRCDYDFINSLFNDSDYLKICKELNRYITGYKEEKSNGKLIKVDKIKGNDSLRLGTSFELGHAYFKDIKKIDKKEIDKLWNSKIEPLLKEYLRAEYTQDEIINKLQEAKSIFTLTKKDNNDTNS